MKRVIYWYRRDLRTSDNTALTEAAQRAECVIPVFVFDDETRSESKVCPARFAFRLQSLEALRENLTELGCPLIVPSGKAEEVLPKLCREVGAEAVFSNKCYEPEAETRDSRVFNALNAAGVGFELFKDAVIWEEQEILTQAGKPFTVFMPYSRAWKEKPIPIPKPQLPRPKSKVQSLKSDLLPASFRELCRVTKKSLWPAGEREALKRLRKFMAGPVYEYAESRNFPAIDGTSQLSPHLNCGTIGIRTVLAALTKARSRTETPAQKRSCDVFLTELIWREFYLQILHNFPHVTAGAFRPEYDKLKWAGNEGHFQAWCEGRTGYPIVDAAMRCLNQTGWMHNRLRMIVAMFLTKDLLLHWQRGERYFMKRLVDGDLAANNGGWQWSAGTGTDAAPYFRIFNPVAQGEKFDPHGEFVRHWVPELASLPEECIHQPWRKPLDLKGTKYPARIIIHEEQRQKCLAMYRKVNR